MANDMKITTSTELMTNYKQVELLDQQDGFSAVQTADGHSMFFGQSTDGKLWLVLEQSGQGTGWTKIEMTTALAGTVKTFAVAQNHTSGAIDMAVAMADPADGTKLYLAMGLSDSDLGWTAKPVDWTYIADDRVGAGNPTLIIDDVHLSESNDGTEYVIVDTDDGKGFVARYWINIKSAPHWNAHPLAFNISSADADKSVMGRKAGEPVDGVYTMGEENNVLQFVYTPVMNPFSPTIAPNPTNFDLSGTGLDATNGSFATCKALSGAANATDIVVAGAGALYYLASEKQDQMAKPQQVLKHPMFAAIHDLQAGVFGSRLVVWGRNDADQVFYTACEAAQVTQAAAWSVPLPLMAGVSEISQYINRANGGLTIFANTGQGKLTKGMQDPVTSRWTYAGIELPVPDVTAKASAEKSFTTSIHVTDANDKPAAHTDVTLTPNGRTNVYINNVFYALSGGPVTVKTDGSGTLMIVEWIDGLTGTSFNVAAGGPASAVAVDPANGPMARMKDLGSVSALESATITQQDGSKKPLLPAGLSDADKQALAQSIADLNTAHADITKSAPKTGVNAGLRLQLAMAVPPSSPLDYVEVLWGDLVKSLEHFGEYVIKLVKDTASEVWHFVVTVGEAVYGFVVDTVEKIAGALKAIWDKICKGFEDLWNFLKYLFEWQDMLLTRDVYKQIIKIFLHRVGEGIQTGKHKLDAAIDNAEAEVKKWAGQTPPDLGSADHSLDATLKGKPTSPGVNSAPGQLLKSHFSSNVQKSTTNEAPSNLPEDPTWSGLADMSSFLDAEKQDMENLKNDIMSLLVSAAGSQANPDFGSILKKIVADIAVAAMDLFKMAADKVMDFMTLLIDEAIALLDAPIHIPVLDDILKDVFGITELPSVLDILCLIAAVPATIGYKIATGKAPFVSGDGSIHDKIVSAKTYAELQANFQQTGDVITLDKDAQAVLFEMCYVAGGLATIINGVLVALDEEVDGAASSKFSTPLTVTSVLAGITLGLGGLFKMPTGIQNETMKEFAGVLSKISLLTVLVFGVAPKAIAKIQGVKGDGPLKALGKEVSAVKSGTNAVLGFIGLVPQGYHICEIIIDGKAGTGAGALGIMDSTQGITSRLGKIAGFAAILDKDPESKQIIILVQGVLIVLTGGIQIAEAITEGTVNA